jgi:AraC-like DNA-binding protein
MSAFLSSLTGLCLFLLVGTFIYRKLIRSKNISIALVLALIFIGYTMLLTILTSFSFYPKIMFLTYTDAIVFYLVMPLLYMYIMNILHQRSFFSPINGINILPSIPGIIYVIFFNTLTNVDQQHMLLGKTCGILDDNWLYLVGLISQLFYMVLIILTINRFIKKNGDLLLKQSLRQLQSFAWVMFIFIIIGVVVSVMVIIIPNVSAIEKVKMIMLFFVFLCVYYLTYLRDTGIPIFLEGSIKISKTAPKTTITNFEQLSAVIFAYIEKHQIYKNPNISIVTFSKNIKISASKISACIKEKYDMSFPEYINKLRIDFVIKRLNEENDSYIKMDFLAQECGFGSRSSFYAEFKKQKGITPAEYQKMKYDCQEQ